MIKWFRKIYSAALAGHEARLRLIAEKKYGGVNAKISASIDYKAIANTLLDEGRFFEAEIQYRNAIRQNKDEPNFYVMLGYVLKEQGKNNEAVEQLTIALQLAPNDFDAHYMLASIAHTDGHFEEAMRRYEDVLTLNPKFEFAYREYSFLLSQRGELQKAHSVIDRAMVNFPDGADYHLIKGNLFLNQKKYDSAIKAYQTAISLRAEFSNAYVQLALTYEEMGQLAEALENANHAASITPPSLVALLTQGKLLIALERRLEALASFDRAIKIDARCVDALANSGTLLYLEGRISEALDFYQRALDVHMNIPVVWLNKSVIAFNNARNLDDALTFVKKSLEIEPDSVEAIHQYGIVLVAFWRPEEALAQFEKALQLDPNHVLSLFDRAKVFQKQEKHEEALLDLTHAIRIDPNFAKAHFDESFSRLVLGDLLLGWQKYEWRWKCEPYKNWERKFPAPLWLGKESLQGKSILIYGEQGLGDTINFARYVSLVVQMGARVILEVQPPLKTLFKNFGGAAEVFAEGEALPPFDYRCSFPSLPGAFNTELATIPSKKIYFDIEQIAPDAAVRWHNKIAELGLRDVKKVGIVWSGSTVHQNDKKRTIAFLEFSKILNTNVQFFSLQKEVRPYEKEALAQESRIIHWGDDLTDFVETAALISHLDLVITVDTSVAHVAASLGKPVWILLPFNPDWRWLLKRSDSPWYPTVTLFRQTQIDDWPTVLNDVSRKLSLM